MVPAQRKLRSSVGNKYHVPREPVSWGCLGRGEVNASRASPSTDTSPRGILQGEGVGIRSANPRAGEEGVLHVSKGESGAGGDGSVDRCQDRGGGAGRVTWAGARWLRRWDNSAFEEKGALFGGAHHRCARSYLFLIQVVCFHSVSAESVFFCDTESFSVLNF